MSREYGSGKSPLDFPGKCRGSKKRKACGVGEKDSPPAQARWQGKEPPLPSTSSDAELPSSVAGPIPAILPPLLKVPNVGGNRTFPSDNARHLIAGMDNPRIFNHNVGVLDECIPSGPGDQEKEKKKKKEQGNSGGQRTCFLPSKNQVAATISKCLPMQDATQFEDLFKGFQCDKKKIPTELSNAGIDPFARVVNTRVVTILWSLQCLYGTDNVAITMCPHMNSDHSKLKILSRRDYLEIILMDCVLTRTTKPPRKVTGREEVDTPVKFQVDDAQLLEAKFDKRFRALIVVVPEAAVYYCHRERRNESVGKCNRHIAMDTSWLRVIKNGNRSSRFALGGYVACLWPGKDDFFWKFKIRCGESNFQLRPLLPVRESLDWNSQRCRKVLHARQCPDELGPRLPADNIEGEDFNSRMLHDSLRRAYRAALQESTSRKIGCRHYCTGFLHRHIDPQFSLVINPMDGDVDVHISVQISRQSLDANSSKMSGKEMYHVALARESVLQVRYLPHLGIPALSLLRDVQVHARSVRETGSPSVRNGLGDKGSMYAVGTRIMHDKHTRSRYVTSSSDAMQENLSKAVSAAARLAAVTVPAVLRVMQDMEGDGGIPPPVGGMNGDGQVCRVTHTMDVSVDLSNSSHYDVNDASQGFSIWTEDSPGTTKDWYFVLPNVYGRRHGDDGHRTYNGLAIRLTHGVLISWDGRVIRHCTSLMNRPKESEHVYGTFFAAKNSIVRYGARIARQRAHELAQQRQQQKVNELTQPEEQTVNDKLVLQTGACITQAVSAADVVQREHQQRDVVWVVEGPVQGEEDNQSWVDDGSLDEENDDDDGEEDKDAGMVVELSNNSDIPLEDVINEDTTALKPPVFLAFKKVLQPMDAADSQCNNGKTSTSPTENMKKVQLIVHVDSHDGPPKTNSLLVQRESK